jgi:hypothetical protein
MGTINIPSGGYLAFNYNPYSANGWYGAQLQLRYHGNATNLKWVQSYTAQSATYTGYSGDPTADGPPSTYPIYSTGPSFYDAPASVGPAT